MIRDLRIEQDRSFAGISNYRWVNIEIHGTRVGKARVRGSGERLVINSITIFPELEGKGFGRKVINIFKRSYKEIVADRVRDSAKRFWEKMGFRDDKNGNHVWKYGKQ